MRRFRCMTAALVITVMLSTLLFYGRTEVAAVLEQNTEEIYPNILYSLLEPAIYHALSGYYDQPMVFDPRDVVIEGVGQVQGPQELSIVIQRYLGPSSRIATDR